jgi:hypothetical protein
MTSMRKREPNLYEQLFKTKDETDRAEKHLKRTLENKKYILDESNEILNELKDCLNDAPKDIIAPFLGVIDLDFKALDEKAVEHRVSECRNELKQHVSEFLRGESKVSSLLTSIGLSSKRLQAQTFLNKATSLLNDYEFKFSQYVLADREAQRMRDELERKDSTHKHIQNRYLLLCKERDRSLPASDSTGLERYTYRRR